MDAPCSASPQSSLCDEKSLHTATPTPTPTPVTSLTSGEQVALSPGMGSLFKALPSTLAKNLE